MRIITRPRYQPMFVAHPQTLHSFLNLLSLLVIFDDFSFIILRLMVLILLCGLPVYVKDQAPLHPRWTNLLSARGTIIRPSLYVVDQPTQAIVMNNGTASFAANCCLWVVCQVSQAYVADLTF